MSTHTEDDTVQDDQEVNTHVLELQDALLSALSASGALGKIRAQVRASTLSLLRGDPALQEAAIGKTGSQSVSAESKIAMMLVQDFLKTHLLDEAAGVLAAEAGNTFSLDDTSALARYQSLPGSGSMLERLVHHGMKGSEVNEMRTSLAAPVETEKNKDSNTETRDEPALSQDGAGTRTVEDLERPSQADNTPPSAAIAKALRDYDSSIDFSDDSGEVDVTAYERVDLR